MLARDWIGMRVEVIESPNPCEIGIAGEVVDETMNMLKIKTERGVKQIAKKGRWFKVKAGDKVYKVKGDLINFRPEERIMRGIIMLKRRKVV